jgi:hypothetical protein
MMMRQKATFCRIGVVLTLILASLGCTCNRRNSRLHRSDLSTWETRQSGASGLRFQAPTDMCYFMDNPTLGVGIELNALASPAGVVDDDRCLLHVEMRRLSKTEYEEQNVPDPLGRSARNDWIRQRHASIGRFDSGQYTYYRYDVGCPNGDVVWTQTEVDNIYNQEGVSLYDQQDEAIVRRILGSVRCVQSFPPTSSTST